ncbi:hypothetical protein [Pseudarthrobacter sp. BIM B-2242]|uniref:hypothetical protein n=1 Tax=Pseudarthrobacter sp. BIM B-2242 TaxID=2772401 RepID=UPI00168B9AE7|nr:hypothetical protein [Pseudarthrobacter sp. BIM B-2242]QOD05677.1 hypothetical protein IDT60_21785 [Pseudarthrobacter sp. BIM B-2242]
MSEVIAHITVRTPSAAVDVWKDDAGELTIRINGLARKWHGVIDLGREPSIEPGSEHAWIRTQVCEALYAAMGRYGLDDYTKTLVSTSRGWYDVCQLANNELGAGRVLE